MAMQAVRTVARWTVPLCGKARRAGALAEDGRVSDQQRLARSRAHGGAEPAIQSLTGTRFCRLHSLDREVEVEISVIPGDSVLCSRDVPSEGRRLLKRTLGLVDRPALDLENRSARIKKWHSNGFCDVAPTNRPDGRGVFLGVSYFVVITGSHVLNKESASEADRQQRKDQCHDDYLALHFLENVSDQAAASGRHR